MKTIFTTLLLAVIFISCFISCQRPNSVEVNVAGWGNDTILVFSGSFKQHEERFDTLIAQNGRFSYDTDPTDTLFLIFTNKKRTHTRKRGYLRLDAHTIEMIIPGNARIKVSGKAHKDHLTYKISGVDYYKDASQVRKKYLPYEIAADSINIQIENMIENSTAQNPFEGTQPLFDRRLEMYEKIRDIKIDYIKSNPQSDLSGLYTSDLSTNRFREGYNLLHDKVKSGFFKKRLKHVDEFTKQYERVEQVKKEKTIDIGKKAPNFELLSSDNTKVSLQQFQGKWVVLDFWGSWCGYCIQEFPQLKETYKKYAGQLEIIGISCNDTEQEWRKTIDKHQLPWIQLIDENKTYTEYAVEGFPTKLIINPEGNIEYIISGAKKAFYTKLDELLSSK